MNNPARMWDYYRDENGTVPALRNYYPELLAKDTILAIAVSQIEMAELAINTRMGQLEEAEE